jgi:hypothetical protein
MGLMNKRTALARVEHLLKVYGFIAVDDRISPELPLDDLFEPTKRLTMHEELLCIKRNYRSGRLSKAAAINAVSEVLERYNAEEEFHVVLFLESARNNLPMGAVPMTHEEERFFSRYEEQMHHGHRARW